MTYLVFLLVFIVPPIVVLALLQPRPLGGVGGRRGVWSLPALCAIAFLYTTPWDNYLVFRGVWGYGPERVLGTIGYVPVEEYLFFLLQPILTGLFAYLVLARSPPPPSPPGRPSLVRAAGTLTYGALALAGALLLLLGGDRSLYLGLILSWAAPVLALMWLYAGPHFWQHRVAFARVLIPATLYLWAADWYAIGSDIWYISDAYSLGFDPLGLPIEEATFFLVTNLLVVQGVILFLHGDRIIPPFLNRSASVSPP